MSPSRWHQEGYEPRVVSDEGWSRAHILYILLPKDTGNTGEQPELDTGVIAAKV